MVPPVFQPTHEGAAVQKMGLAGASLAAAIPGAVLTVLTLMAVLGAINEMPTVLMIASLVLLLTAGAMALFPLYILTWYRPGGRSSVASTATAGAPATGAVTAATAEAEVDVDEFDAETAETFGGEVADDFDEFEGSLSGGAEEDEFGEFEAADSFDDEFEFEDFDDDKK